MARCDLLNPVVAMEGGEEQGRTVHGSNHATGVVCIRNFRRIQYFVIAKRTAMHEAYADPRFKLQYLHMLEKRKCALRPGSSACIRCQSSSPNERAECLHPDIHSLSVREIRASVLVLFLGLSL